MNVSVISLTSVLLLVTACVAPSRGLPPPSARVQPPPPAVPEYTIRRVGSGVTVDGRLDESDWRRAETVRLALPWTNTTREKRQDTRAMMLWDDANLYIGYECDDPYLEGEVTAHDGPVYNEDTVEIFVTPNPADTSCYFGYEMNLLGTFLDYLAFEGGTERTKSIHFSWESEGVRIATRHVGTLNDHSDIDVGWSLEIAIPLGNFRHLGGRIPPRDGDTWRLNLNRCAGQRGQFAVWSDTHTEQPSFHHSDYFGKAHFSDRAVGR